MKINISNSSPSSWATAPAPPVCGALDTLTEEEETRRPSLRAYLVAVAGVGISEPLDVVEDEPGERDDHQHDEGDGHEHHRRPAHVLLQVPRADGDRHGDRHVALQQRRHLAALGLRNHDGDNLAGACRRRRDTL